MGRRGGRHPRVGVLVNPVAGAGRALRIWRQLVSATPARRRNWDVAFTEAPGHATVLARRALDKGIERLVVVGGDGTIQETAIALEGSRTVLGVIRAGTGNDFARTHLIPKDPPKALELACTGGYIENDLGRVNGHLFVNVAGLGFDAEVAAWCHNRMRTAGQMVYVAGVFAQLMRFSPQVMTFTLDGRTYERRCLVLAVGTGRYYGGGMMMCPGADPTDGLFDVCVGGDVGKLQTIRLLTMVFSGRHIGHPKVSVFRAKRIIVQSPARLAIHADGEPVGHVPADFSLSTGRLLVAVPSARAQLQSGFDEDLAGGPGGES